MILLSVRPTWHTLSLYIFASALVEHGACITVTFISGVLSIPVEWTECSGFLQCEQVSFAVRWRRLLLEVLPETDSDAPLPPKQGSNQDLVARSEVLKWPVYCSSAGLTASHGIFGP